MQVWRIESSGRRSPSISGTRPTTRSCSRCAGSTDRSGTRARTGPSDGPASEASLAVPPGAEVTLTVASNPAGRGSAGRGSRCSSTGAPRWSPGPLPTFWRRFVVSVPPGSQPAELTIRSSVFNPEELGVQPPDGRDLGIQLYRVDFEPRAGLRGALPGGRPASAPRALAEPCRRKRRTGRGPLRRPCRTPGPASPIRIRIAAVTPAEMTMAASASRCAPARRIRRASPGPGRGTWRRTSTRLRAGAATAVVSLITDEEIDYLGVRGLAGAVRERHMEWWHVPIRDGRPPGARLRGRVVPQQAKRSGTGCGRASTCWCTARAGSVGPGPSPPGCSWSSVQGRTKRCAGCARRGSQYAIETRSQEGHVAECAARTPVGASRLRPSRRHGEHPGPRPRRPAGVSRWATRSARRSSSARGTRSRGWRTWSGEGLSTSRRAPGPTTRPSPWRSRRASPRRVEFDGRDLMDRFVDWWRNGRYSCSGHCFDIGQHHARGARAVQPDRRSGGRLDCAGERRQRLPDASRSRGSPLLEPPRSAW